MPQTGKIKSIAALSATRISSYKINMIHGEERRRALKANRRQRKITNADIMTAITDRHRRFAAFRLATTFFGPGYPGAAKHQNVINTNRKEEENEGDIQKQSIYRQTRLCRF